MHKFNPNKAQRSEIAGIFGVHPSTVSRWKAAGCPVCEDGKTFRAADVHKWLLEHAIADLRPGPDDGMEGANSPALERWREERAKIAKIERQKLEGSLIDRQEVYQGWAQRVRDVTAGLEFFKDRLPPLLVGKTREELRSIIAGEVFYLRKSYARTGQYCSPPDGESWPENEAEK